MKLNIYFIAHDKYWKFLTVLAYLLLVIGTCVHLGWCCLEVLCVQLLSVILYLFCLHHMLNLFSICSIVLTPSVPTSSAIWYASSTILLSNEYASIFDVIEMSESSIASWNISSKFWLHSKCSIYDFTYSIKKFIRIYDNAIWKIIFKWSRAYNEGKLSSIGKHLGVDFLRLGPCTSFTTRLWSECWLHLGVEFLYARCMYALHHLTAMSLCAKPWKFSPFASKIISNSQTIMMLFLCCVCHVFSDML